MLEGDGDVRFRRGDGTTFQELRKGRRGRPGLARARTPNAFALVGSWVVGMIVAGTYQSKANAEFWDAFNTYNDTATPNCGPERR